MFNFFVEKKKSKSRTKKNGKRESKKNVDTHKKKKGKWKVRKFFFKQNIKSVANLHTYTHKN